MTNFLRNFSKKLLNDFKNNISPYALSGCRSLFSTIHVTEMEPEIDQTNVKLTKQTTRYNGRVKKRQWENKGRSRNQEDESDASKRVCTEPFERIKRRKVAMLFAYSGVNYFGMQRNPDVLTIEEDLLKALFTAKYITDEAFKQIQTIQFQRAARTDKGVSAARQVVSLKMPDDIKISTINELLPPEIRIFSIKRVTKGFNSKSQCDARTYIYMLPTFSFEKHDIPVPDVESYRISTELIENVRILLKKYEGTRNFHNFTSKKEFMDPSSKRYMMSFECGEPFINDKMEFVVLKVKGQSFMLHQIRKMVGLALAITRGLTDDETLERSWTSDRIDLPMAPGLGLILDQVHYDRYNNRYSKDGFHESLTWDDIESDIEEFKKNFIYPNIITTEQKEKSMENWLQTLNFHSYDVRDENKTGQNELDLEQNSDDEVEEIDEDTAKKATETADVKISA